MRKQNGLISDGRLRSVDGKECGAHYICYAVKHGQNDCLWQFGLQMNARNTIECQ